ncbi:hypothetical protein, partial [Mesorhizobium sp.]|uniref:hypothetical protein n=1 Tax=Mesorhizobium sp. TaxID=1871066 RepID=UPI0025EB1BEB
TIRHPESPCSNLHHRITVRLLCKGLLVGEGGSARSAETDEGRWKKRRVKISNDFKLSRLESRDPSNTPHPTELRSATFSHKGEKVSQRCF